MNPGGLHVIDLPTSNTNKRWAYARAEYINASGERRVLVWQVRVDSRGRRGQMALRPDRGANNIEGTDETLSGPDLMNCVDQIEKTGVIPFAGDTIYFPHPFREEFVRRCRQRMADAST